MKKIEVLGESNYHLLVGGRNLNQAAKATNEGRRDAVTIQSIERLRGIIGAHTEQVSTAIRASVDVCISSKRDAHSQNGSLATGTIRSADEADLRHS